MARQWVVAAALVWLLYACGAPTQALAMEITAPEGWKATAESSDSAAVVDYAALQHPDIANLLKYPACESFLLKGASHVEEAWKPDVASQLSWQYGSWYRSDRDGMPSFAAVPKLSEPSLKIHYTPFPRSNHGHTTFNVTQASEEWAGWRPSSAAKHVLHAVDGVLTLGGFWSQRRSFRTRSAHINTGNGSPLEFYWDSDKVMTVVLRGAYVTTETERRVCMLGCIAHPTTFPVGSSHVSMDCDSSGHCVDNPRNSTHAPFEKDCKIMLQMRYPKHHSLMSRQVQAELTSLRNADDPLYIAPVSVHGPSPAVYEFAPEPYLGRALDNGTATGADICGGMNLTNRPALLEQYLQYYVLLQAETELLSGPSPRTRHPFAAGRRGPRHYGSISLSFTDVVARADAGGGLLVSGLMLPYEEEAAQQFFSVEGKWSPASGELCMVGCWSNFSTAARAAAKNDTFVVGDGGCDCRICLHSALQKHVTIDSPGGAVLSSLREAHHPDYFPPLRFHGTELAYRLHDSNRNVTEDCNVYRYTRAARALALAKKHRAPNVTEHVATRGLRFPAPAEGKLCSGIDQMRGDMMIDQQNTEMKHAHGERVHMYLDLTNLESCTPYGMWAYTQSRREPYAAETYLRVAVVLNLWKLPPTKERGHYYWRPNAATHRAEGVYEPYTGEMHLVASVQAKNCAENGTEVVPLGGLLRQLCASVTEVEDREVYVRIQYPSLDPTSAEQRKMKWSVQSLRPQSDPLHFAPLEVEAKGHMYGMMAVAEAAEAHNKDFRGLLMQTLLIVCLMRQIRHSRRNSELLPFVSQTMLVVQLLCQAAQSITFPISLSSRMMYYGQLVQFHGLDLAVRALALVAALLFMVLAGQAYEARDRLRVMSRRKRSSKSPSANPPCEETTFKLSLVAFGLLLAAALLSAWFAASHPYAPTLWQQFGSFFDHSAIATLQRGLATFRKLMQEFYLVPQVIANALGDVQGAPLCASFIAGPSLLYVLSYSYTIYSWFTPDVLLGSSSSSDDLLVTAGNLAVAACVCALAVVVNLQQRRGGRLGWYPSPAPSQPDSDAGIGPEDPQISNEDYLDEIAPLLARGHETV